MAKASLITVTDNKTIIVEPERIIPAVTRNKVVEATEVTLKLTLAEAECLQTLIRNWVIGSPTKSPRKYIQRVFDAMKAAGVQHDTEHYKANWKPALGRLEFQNYPKKAKPVQPQPVKLEEPKKAPEGIKVGDTVVILSTPYNSKAYAVGKVGTVVGLNGSDGQSRGQFAVNSDDFDVFNSLNFTGDELAVIHPDQEPKKGDKVVVVDDEGGVDRGAVGTITKVDKADPWNNALGKHFLHILWDAPKPYYGGLYSRRVKIIK